MSPGGGGGGNWVSRTGIGSGLKRFLKSVSFAPAGLVLLKSFNPRLAPWAAFFRRFAAGTIRGLKPRFQFCCSYGTAEAVPLQTNLR